MSPTRTHTTHTHTQKPFFLKKDFLSSIFIHHLLRSDFSLSLSLSLFVGRFRLISSLFEDWLVESEEEEEDEEQVAIAIAKSSIKVHHARRRCQLVR